MTGFKFTTYIPDAVVTFPGQPIGDFVGTDDTGSKPIGTGATDGVSVGVEGAADGTSGVAVRGVSFGIKSATPAGMFVGTCEGVTKSTITLLINTLVRGLVDN